VCSQERDDLGGGAERIGDGRAVVQRQGGAELTVDLGHQDRRARGAGGAVECRQTQEREFIIGVARADEDLGGGQRVHVTRVTGLSHKGK
jgi:hypothetical protein